LLNLALEKVIGGIGEELVMKLNENMTILVYAGDIVILRNSCQEVVYTVEKLTASSRNMSLIINEANTKCMLMAHHMPIKNDLVV